MLQPFTDLCSGETIHEWIIVACLLKERMRSLVDFGTLCVAGMLHAGCVLNVDEVLGMDESTVLVWYMHKITTVAMRSPRNHQAELEGAFLQIAKMTSVLVRDAGIPGLAVAQFPRQAGTVFGGKALQNLFSLFPSMDEWWLASLPSTHCSPFESRLVCINCSRARQPMLWPVTASRCRHTSCP